MIEHPFQLFTQFEDRLRIIVFQREDNFSDALASKVFGGANTAGLEQVHGNRTLITRESIPRTEEADGLATDAKNLALSVRWADCQNFVIYAPEKNVIGTVHVGWKGLLAEALAEHYRILKEEWNIEPEETYVGAGPSLCLQCAEFSDPATELPCVNSELIHDHYVDLRGIANSQLDALGVSDAQRERMPSCTRCEPESYWTYRGGDKEAVLSGNTNALCAMLLDGV